jgi:WD40 repeat protein
MAQAVSYGGHSGDMRGRQRALSPNGRFVYTGDKEDPFIDVHDTSTGDFSTIELDTLGGSDEGSVAGLAASADGSAVYALVSFGAHYNGYDADDDLESVTLVELDALTMEETRRVDIHSWAAGDPESRMARFLAWSPDGTVLAASLGSGNNDSESSNNELWFIDVETMTVIDTNPDTPDEADPVVLPAQGFGEQMVWEGDYVIVGHNMKNAIAVESVANLSFVHSGTYEVTTVEPPAGHGGRASTMSSGSGVVYYASREGDAEDVFSAFDVATQTEIYTVVLDMGQIRFAMVDPVSGNLFVGAYDEDIGQQAWVFDAATGEAIDADGDPTNGISSIEHESSGAHSIVMTPF